MPWGYSHSLGVCTLPGHIYIPPGDVNISDPGGKPREVSNSGGPKGEVGFEFSRLRSQYLPTHYHWAVQRLPIGYASVARWVIDELANKFIAFCELSWRPQ